MSFLAFLVAVAAAPASLQVMASPIRGHGLSQAAGLMLCAGVHCYLATGIGGLLQVSVATVVLSALMAHLAVRFNANKCLGVARRTWSAWHSARQPGCPAVTISRPGRPAVPATLNAPLRSDLRGGSRLI
jgi:threonine/homoserine/homoserine lactone efflux protein